MKPWKLSNEKKKKSWRFELDPPTWYFDLLTAKPSNEKSKKTKPWKLSNKIHIFQQFCSTFLIPVILAFNVITLFKNPLWNCTFHLSQETLAVKVLSAVSQAGDISRVDKTPSRCNIIWYFIHQTTQSPLHRCHFCRLPCRRNRFEISFFFCWASVSCLRTDNIHTERTFI